MPNNIVTTNDCALFLNTLVIETWNGSGRSGLVVHFEHMVLEAMTFLTTGYAAIADVLRM